MFKKLTGNTITFITTAIYYAIKEYKTGPRVIDNFFGSTVSGLYIFSILLFSNSLTHYKNLRQPFKQLELNM